jgi:hypothetical protein
MDLNTLKGRIAEAFVENILRAAGYAVCRSGRESQVQRLFMTGEGEFLPDFFVWRGADTSPHCAPLHRLLPVEVKFRSNLEGFLRPSEVERLRASAARWPVLYLVLVTDSPAQGRSCFQLLDLTETNSDAPLAPTDLCEARALGIQKTITDRYEQLLRQVFLPLQDNSQLRKPPARLLGPKESSRSRACPPQPHAL